MQNNVAYNSLYGLVENITAVGHDEAKLKKIQTEALNIAKAVDQEIYKLQAIAYEMAFKIISEIGETACILPATQKDAMEVKSVLEDLAPIFNPTVVRRDFIRMIEGDVSCMLIDDLDAGNKFHRWHISMVDYKDRKNPDGPLSTHDTFSGAMSKISEHIKMYTGTSNKKILIEVVIIDPTGEETPVDVKQYFETTLRKEPESEEEKA